MPPLPSPGPIVRVTFLMGIDASIEAGSRFFLAYSGGTPNVTDLNTAAEDIADYWETNIAPLVNADESLHGVNVRDLSSDVGALGVWEGTKAGTGTAYPQLPASACAVVNHVTGVSYRGGHPRTYLRCGQADAYYQDGTNLWTADFAAAVQAGWEAWIAACLAISGISVTFDNIVNVSYYSGYNTSTPPWRGPGFKYPSKLRDTPRVETITSSNVALKVGSQRRRLNA